MKQYSTFCFNGLGDYLCKNIMEGKAFPLIRACSLGHTLFERGDPAMPPHRLQSLHRYASLGTETAAL